MEKLKQWVAITVVAVLGIAAAGWFLLISPKNSEANDLKTEADAQTAATQVLRNDIKTLQAQAKALPKERGKLAAVAAKLPSDPGMPALIRALSDAADEAGLKFVSLTPGTPIAATSAVAATPKTNADGEVVAAAAAAPTGLTTIPVQISVFGGFYQAQQFAAQLESLPRAFRVTTLNIAPGGDPGNAGDKGKTAEFDGQHLLATISGEVYMSTAAALSPTTTPTAPVGASGTAG